MPGQYHLMRWCAEHCVHDVGSKSDYDDNDDNDDDYDDDYDNDNDDDNDFDDDDDNHLISGQTFSLLW